MGSVTRGQTDASVLRAQLNLVDAQTASLDMARSFVQGKLRSQRTLLTRFIDTNTADEACEPETASILFEEGPIALGWARCRDIENANSLRALRLSIRNAVAAGELHSDSIELTTRLLNAILGETARALVYPSAEPIDREDVASTVRNTISALAQDHRP